PEPVDDRGRFGLVDDEEVDPAEHVRDVRRGCGVEHRERAPGPAVLEGGGGRVEAELELAHEHVTGGEEVEVFASAGSGVGAVGAGNDDDMVLPRGIHSDERLARRAIPLPEAGEAEPGLTCERVTKRGAG